MAAIEATSRSRMLQVRGRRYHLRCWGAEERAPVLLLHGAMDTSASFEFLARCLPPTRRYVAPDWCGCGRSEQVYAHWFPDYLADLDAIVQDLAPQGALDIVGHSRGGNIATIYAGARPERVRRLVTIEGIAYSAAAGADPVRDLSEWLDQERDRRKPKTYGSVDQIAQSLLRNNPRLTSERAHFLAREWAREEGGGRVALSTVFFPREKEGVCVSLETYRAFWVRITAPVLYVSGGRSHITRYFAEHPEAFEQRTSAIPDLQVSEVSAAGHMVHYDEPEALAALIDHFLGEGAPGTASAASSPDAREPVR